jgi:hypothetical protein
MAIKRELVRAVVRAYSRAGDVVDALVKVAPA